MICYLKALYVATSWSFLIAGAGKVLQKAIQFIIFPSKVSFPNFAWKLSKFKEISSLQAGVETI